MMDLFDEKVLKGVALGVIGTLGIQRILSHQNSNNESSENNEQPQKVDAELFFCLCVFLFVCLFC